MHLLAEKSVLKVLALILALSVLSGCASHQPGVVRRKTLTERWREFVEREDQRAADFRLF